MKNFLMIMTVVFTVGPTVYAQTPTAPNLKLMANKSVSTYVDQDGLRDFFEGKQRCKFHYPDKNKLAYSIDCGSKIVFKAVGTTGQLESPKTIQDLNQMLEDIRAGKIKPNSP